MPQCSCVQDAEVLYGAVSRASDDILSGYVEKLEKEYLPHLVEAANEVLGLELYEDDSIPVLVDDLYGPLGVTACLNEKCFIALERNLYSPIFDAYVDALDTTQDKKELLKDFMRSYVLLHEYSHYLVMTQYEEAVKTLRDFCSNGVVAEEAVASYLEGLAEALTKETFRQAGKPEYAELVDQLSPYYSSLKKIENGDAPADLLPALEKTGKVADYLENFN